MSINILGISCFYHDAASCLLRDGKIIAAAQEERFTRKKHDFDFPINSINYCLKQGGLSIDQVDYIGFYEKPLLKFDRIIHQHLEAFPKSLPTFLKTLPSYLNEKIRIEKTINKKLKYKGPILFINHHLAHAASSFFVSPFKEAAVLTVDGVGEWSTTTYGYGKDNEITLLKEIKYPHSLGLLYSTFTAYLGFSVNNSEYKVMGLSAYGNPIYFEKFLDIIDVKEDGSFRLDMSFFDFNHKMTMPGKKITDYFGPPRTKEGEIEQRHKDVAASLQKTLEHALFKILNNVYSQTQMKNLCMSGGVALNSVANGKITKNTPFERVFIQPASSDSGTSIGAATYIYNSLLKNNRKFHHQHVYLGPEFSDDYMLNFFKENQINFRRLPEQQMVKDVAKLVFENNVVGWFQSKMEWGPRALGNRSILANPLNQRMQDILNLKVKHREQFRPFAPVILKDFVHDYFDIDKDEEPYMLFVHKIKEDKRESIPAVTHVDGTGRVQTVSKEQNFKYYSVIDEFRKLSGCPILINTSFNIRGEPIVCTPEDAYRCMMGTGIDYLALGNFLIKREDNKKDIWDSESVAKD